MKMFLPPLMELDGRLCRKLSYHTTEKLFDAFLDSVFAV